MKGLGEVGSSFTVYVWKLLLGCQEVEFLSSGAHANCTGTSSLQEGTGEQAAPSVSHIFIFFNHKQSLLGI